MQLILVLISMILFILLCIGLIKPTLASNIMEKLPEPIGNFSKGINSRKKVLLYYGLLFLFIQIIISSLIPLSDYDAGKKYYDKNDWSKAISYFNDVPTLDVNYNEAQRLLLIAKNNLIKGEPDKALEVAKIAFKEKRWNEVIDLLQLFPQEHTLNEEVDKLVFNAKENKFNEEMELMIEKATKQLMEYNWDEVSETDRDEVNKLLLTIPNEHRLFSKANIILSKARGRKSQQDFINKWKKLKKINDDDGGDKHLNENRSKVIDWFGKVKYTSLSTIQLEHSGIEYNLYPEVPLDTNNLNIESLDYAEKVFFTGSLNGEKSWTSSGRLSEPEIKIKCYKITNVDETEIYYDLTSNIAQAEAKAKEEAKRKEGLAKREAKRKEILAKEEAEEKRKLDKQKEEDRQRKEKECKRDLQCWGDEHLLSASFACESSIESLAKYDHKWTNGWLTPKFSRFSWQDKSKGIITYYGSTLQFQNGFGAFQNMSYKCTYDPINETVIDFGVW